MMEFTETFREFDAGDIQCNPESCEAGSGGFGDVLFGFHKMLKHDVAVKVFAITGGQQEKKMMVKKIKEEMEHLQKAKHINIVAILGFVKWTFAMGIVMEYCKGGNLRNLILTTSIELGIPLRLRILTEIAKGISFCHSLPGKRLIHGDVKPDNVLLTEELHCKIADFGSAEFATLSSSTTIDSSARTKKDRVQYTPFYTAPEKLKDPTMKPRKELDIFAFAILIYQVLVREAPYPRGDRKEILDAVKEGMRPDCHGLHEWMETLTTEEREIVVQLEQLMKRCWSDIASERPTMEQVAEELQQLLDEQNTAAILQQVANALIQMELDDEPEIDESRTVPLYRYSTRYGGFPRASIRYDSEEHSTPSSTKKDLTNNKSNEPLLHVSLQVSSSDVQTCNPQPVARELHIVEEPSANSGVNQSAEAHIDQTAVKERPISEKPAVELDEARNQLVQQYVLLVQNKNASYKRTESTKQKLLRLIENQSDITAEGTMTNAQLQRDQENYLKAILFYKIAFHLFVKNERPNIATNGIKRCLLGLKETSELLLDMAGTNLYIVRDQVIPSMLDMRSQIPCFVNVDSELQCLCSVEGLYNIERVQRLVGDNASRESTAKFARKLLEKTFGNQSPKYIVYGNLFHALAEVYWETEQFQESERFCKKAIEAKLKATDLTEDERQNEVQKSKDILQLVEARLQAVLVH